MSLFLAGALWVLSTLLVFVFGLGLGARTIIRRMVKYAVNYDAEFEAGLRRWNRYREEHPHGDK